MGGWVGYTGYPPRHLPGPIFNIYLRLKPYLRPNEGNSEVNDEVSQIGSRIDLRKGPELTQNRPQIRPSRLVPR